MIIIGGHLLIGSLSVLKYNKSTYKWDNLSGTQYFSSGSGDGYNYRYLRYIDPSCLIDFSQGLSLELAIYTGETSGVGIKGNLFSYRGYYCYLPVLDNFNGTFKLWVGYFKNFSYDFTELGQSASKYCKFRNPSVTFFINNQTLNLNSSYTVNYDNVDENGFININLYEFLSAVEVNSSCSYKLTLNALVYCDSYNNDISSEFYMTQKFEYSADYTFSSDGINVNNIKLDKDSANSNLPSHVGTGAWDNKNEGDKTIWDNIKDFLVGLIVPNEEYWNNTYTDLSDTLNEKIPYKSYLDSLSNYTDINVENGDAIDVSIKLDNFKYGNQTLSLNKFIDFRYFLKFPTDMVHLG